MRIKTIGTGSSGNAYILTTSQGKHLLLDAGLPIMDIKKGLNFDLGNLEGCIVTHEHRDHLRSASKIENMGIRVFRPYELPPKFLKTHIGDFEITSFSVPHNGTENRAFYIKADEERILYATDFEYIAYDLRKQHLTVMLVECNYMDTMLGENTHIQHTVLGHASLNTCKGVVKTNATEDLKAVILIHASESGCLNKAQAVSEVQAIVPKAKVYMATKGLTVDI